MDDLTTKKIFCYLAILALLGLCVAVSISMKFYVFAVVLTLVAVLQLFFGI